MSLLDDALKRQEELNRAAGKGTAGGQPPQTSASAPASAPPSRNWPVRPPKPDTPPPKNPFLEREKNQPRSTPNFFMPVLALLVLIALLFLRREFIGKPTQPQLAADELDLVEEVELADAPPLAIVTNTVVVVTNVPPVAENAPVAEVPAVLNAQSEALSVEPSVTDAVAIATNAVAEVAESAVAELANVVEPARARALEWPLFTLTGIAVGRERLAILDSGEMLISGEVARCGAKVMNVSTSSVTFAWRGETKTLRKGERSDKMPQQE